MSLEENRNCGCHEMMEPKCTCHCECEEERTVDFEARREMMQQIRRY